MNKDNIKARIVVKNQVINVIRIDDKEFIPLTGLARYADEDDPRYPIKKENNGFEWVKLMNNYKNMAEEIVLNELIYN